jgi:hypothetical protein
MRPTHAERGRVLELLERLEAMGWKAGEPLPAEVEGEPAEA